MSLAGFIVNTLNIISFALFKTVISFILPEYENDVSPFLMIKFLVMEPNFNSMA